MEELGHWLPDSTQRVCLRKKTGAPMRPTSSTRGVCAVLLHVSNGVFIHRSLALPRSLPGVLGVATPWSQAVQCSPC